MNDIDPESILRHRMPMSSPDQIARREATRIYEVLTKPGLREDLYMGRMASYSWINTYAAKVDIIVACIRHGGDPWDTVATALAQLAMEVNEQHGLIVGRMLLETPPVQVIMPPGVSPEGILERAGVLPRRSWWRRFWNWGWNA